MQRFFTPIPPSSGFPIMARRTALAAALLAAMGLAANGPARAAPDGGAGWSPASSERLIKLPASYLKKAVDRDYAKSGLAAAMQESESSVRLKHQTLQDLQEAIDRAEGKLRVDLRHRFLAEKRAYLELMASQQTLRRKRARTKVKLYERLMRKLGYRRTAMTPQKVALVGKQQAALRRLNASSARVDTKFFRSSMGKESRYAAAYAANLSAIERLVQAIGAHPMNDEARGDTAGLSKEDHLRGLIAAAEAELATLGQEASILGFMAKLVSLDAMALSEDVLGVDGDGNETNEPGSGLTKAVDLFVTR
jgi:hypothetical protein